MITDMQNRTAERKQGRPPASEPRMAAEEARVDTTQRHVPPLVCPKCGRGMTPRVERWETSGEASCICTLSNCRFLYRQAMVRVK